MQVRGGGKHFWILCSAAVDSKTSADEASPDEMRSGNPREDDF